MLNKSKSLEEVHSTIDTTIQSGFWRKLFAFLGPAYLISVGYMDPGNWATDIAAGSRLGYTLIWVILMSNLMALLLQSLSARLGLVRGLDLAQASKEAYSKIVTIILYFFAEIAIAACDLAEVLGMAIGLQLLFKIPLITGIAITMFDTIILLFLINSGMRKIEALILALIIIIGLAFLIEILFAKPDLIEVAGGLIPSIPNEYALYIAIGIIGATVMPHNLYLHSSLVQTRKYDLKEKGIKEAIKFNFLDSAIALNLAFLVNAAILILAAAAFFKSAMFNVTEISDAYRFLSPILGNKIAPILFAAALIASGQSSTLTGTLAGQVVMEGYLNLRIQPWLRRIITRLMAILPAMIVIYIYGESAVGELLILSQVILSLQLGFAVIPLIHFVSDKSKMGVFRIKSVTKILSWLTAAIIVVLNTKLVIDVITGWLSNSREPAYLWLSVVPISIFSGLVLLYVFLYPLVGKVLRKAYFSPHKKTIDEYEFSRKPAYSRIAIALDLSGIDNEVINYAMNLGSANTNYLLVHVVESAGAIFMGNEIRDYETSDDEAILDKYASEFINYGYLSESKIGFGNPRKVIPKIVREFQAELLVMGSHGHKMIKDIIFGTTIESVRHNLNIPVLIVNK